MVTEPGVPIGVGRVRIRPDAWLAGLSWAVVVLSCLQILLFGFGRDQGIYAVVGDAVLEGRMPYRDAWDFKPPGIFLVFAAAQGLFGKSMASVRILEIAGLLATVLAFRRLGRKLLGSTLAGQLGGALAVLIHAELEFWHTAQPESFGGMLTMFALVLVTGRGVEGERAWGRLAAWAGAGALFGAAFLLKPPLGGGALPCAVYLGATELRRGRRLVAALAPAVVLGASSVVPIALVAGWFALRDAWPALHWTLFEFTPGYTKLGWSGDPLGLYRYGIVEALTGFSLVLPVGLGASVLLPAAAPRERGALALVLGVFLVHAAGIAMQAKFFQYHYGATLPVLCIAAGAGLAKLWRLALRLRLPGAIAYVGALGTLAAMLVALRHNPGTFWERSRDRLQFLLFRAPSREALDRKLYHVVDYDLDNDRRAAREVALRSAPGDSVFVWGFEPQVYWFADRRPASRFIYDVPQRARWERERARAELIADLRRDPPRVVVVEHGDRFSFVTGDDLDSAAALDGFPELRDFIDEHYAPALVVDDLELFGRP